MACRCTHIILADCCGACEPRPVIPVRTKVEVFRSYSITRFKGGRPVEDYEPHRSSHAIASFVAVAVLVILLFLWLSSLTWTYSV